MATKFKWNQHLYNTIEKSLSDNIQVLENKKCYNIINSKYEGLIKDITEEYLTHPYGPYNGTKDQLKNDKDYISKSLINNFKLVKFYGDVIQAAIDEATLNGGGKVIIPGSNDSKNPNVYYTGAINIKSNVELNIEQNAIVKFIRNKSNQYYPLVYTRFEGVELMNFSPFIYSYEEENISVTGEGILDGNADEFNWMPWKFGYFNEKDQQIQRERLFELGQTDANVRTERIFKDDISTIRPPFIQFYKSKNILLADIKIINSPFWQVNPVLCENIKVNGIKIESNLYNNDGVDPESCKNIIIENCEFLTGDDCIAIKSGRNNDGRRIGIPCENIIIRNNFFQDGHGGITIGSEISGGVRNVLAHDNHFDSTELDYPIRFKTNAERGGIIENIYIKNSTVKKSKLAVIHADFFYEEGTNGTNKPILRNITLSNIKTVDGESIEAKNSIYLKGFENSPIENIFLEDLTLDGVKGEAVLQNIKNVTFKNVCINGKKIDDKTIDVNNTSEIICYR